MIVHFLQVWLLVAIAFAVGCAIGAWGYGLIADSRLALAQGAIADQIGDGLDRLKAAVGIGPEWRSQHLKAVARPMPIRSQPPPPPSLAPEEEADIIDDDGDDYARGSAAIPAALPPPRYDERRAVPAVRPPVRSVESFGVDEPVFFGGDPTRVAWAEAIGRDGIVPRRPAGVASPRNGVPDNLTRIRGIGDRNETVLNKLGIFHFGQIAAWTPAEVRWIGQYLAFPERVERDDWVGQAAVLAAGGDTGFEKAADRRRRRRRGERGAEDDSGTEE